MSKEEKIYSVYIVRCSDDTLYTGITTDVDKRVKEHNESIKGAKYTKVRRPVSLVYDEKIGSRSDASKREYAIKQMKRKDKLRLFET